MIQRDRPAAQSNESQIAAAEKEARFEINQRMQRDPHWHGQIQITYQFVDGRLDRFVTQVTNSIKTQSR